MWNSRGSQLDVPAPSSSPDLEPPLPRTGPAEVQRPASGTVRTSAWLGPSIEIKGKISGNEDLHIDGKVEGPVSLGGHRLTVGRSGEVTAEVAAREIIVYGKINGNVRGGERIEIKRDGSVIGDLTTARIVIEDGAYFKGRIEIARGNKQAEPAVESLVPVQAAKLS